MKTLLKRLSVIIALALVFSITTPIFLPKFMGTQIAYGATLKLNTQKLSLTVGDKYLLKVLNLGKSQTVKWSSNNKAVAIVYKGGTVKAVSAGTAKITAAIGSKKLSCNVVVQKKIVNEPDISAFVLDSDDFMNTISILVVENNGDLPITFCLQGYMLNDGYANLSRSVYLFDSEDKKSFSLIESVEVDAGEIGYIWYRTEDLSDEFWLDKETDFLFNFTYDDVEFTGSTDIEGHFFYYQGFLPE